MVGATIATAHRQHWSPMRPPWKSTL